MTLDEIEYYHDRGLMPDWAYYQQNGKEPYQNLQEQRRKFNDRLNEQKREKQQQEALEKYVSDLLEKELEKNLEKILGNVLKGL